MKNFLFTLAPIHELALVLALNPALPAGRLTLNLTLSYPLFYKQKFFTGFT